LSSGSGVVAGPVSSLMFDTKVNGLDLSMWVDKDGDETATA